MPTPQFQIQEAEREQQSIWKQIQELQAKSNRLKQQMQQQLKSPQQIRRGEHAHQLRRRRTQEPMCRPFTSHSILQSHIIRQQQQQQQQIRMQEEMRRRGISSPTHGRPQQPPQPPQPPLTPRANLRNDVAFWEGQQQLQQNLEKIQQPPKPNLPQQQHFHQIQQPQMVHLLQPPPVEQQFQHQYHQQQQHQRQYEQNPHDKHFQRQVPQQLRPRQQQMLQQEWQQQPQQPQG
uniref:Uncharacterized protein n=1 Tax=Panagrolaimus superbus TaxID=310955 RepID=A0A914Y869_9BILA